MSFVFYKQPDGMDCGPACLRMVAKHYKRNIGLKHLREKTQIGSEKQLISKSTCKSL
jgi:ATP-binding cassette subfamily B protein